MTIKYFTATKAFLKRDGKILVLRESGKYKDGHNQNYYDVPGGRIEPGEELLHGLKREIFEESGLHFSNAIPFYESTIHIMKGSETWEINRHYFVCEALDGEVALSADHDDYQWIDPTKYSETNIIPDLADVFEAYLARNHGN